MSYHAANNLRSNLVRQVAFVPRQQMPKAPSPRFTTQDIYNGYAWVVGNALAWGIIGLAAYCFARPYVLLLLSDNLL